MKYVGSYSILVCILLLALALATCAMPSTNPTPTPSQEPEAATETPDPSSITADAPDEQQSETSPVPTPVTEPQPEVSFTPVPVLEPQLEPCCPCGTPPAELIQYSSAQNTPWHRIPSIVIAAKPGDPRIQLTEDAVDFWNRRLSEVGTPFRFGPVTRRIQMISVDYLEELSQSLGGGQKPPTPQPIADIPEDIIVALSDGDFVSFSSRLDPEKKLVGIRDCSDAPLNLNNVQRNLIAHELGHLLGLGHNNDPTKLMCGRPATCRPGDYHCEVDEFFPLTSWEKAHLLRLYPASWAPE